MTAALDFQALADLTGGRLGTTDTACPLCGPDRRSPANCKRRVFRIWTEPGFASFHCARCGERGWARSDGAADVDPARLKQLRREAADRDRDHQQRQLDKARWLWGRRKPIGGSPAAKYLRGARGYCGPLPATLGFLSPARPEHHPALIAAFGIPSEPEPGLLSISEDSVQGVHLTLLQPDGSGKAGTDRDKIMIGPSNGWPLVLAAPNDGLGIAVTEGIEDALTVHGATGLGAWAAGSAGRMPGLADKVPAYVESVTIYCDDDPAGQRGAHQLAEALDARGVEVFLEAAK